MTQCQTPITMRNKTEAMNIFWDVPATFTFPCGKCPICIENTIKDWSIRCGHESEYHKHNCHITLTMSDAYMKSRGHTRLDKDELKTFIRNLRNYLRGTDIKIKYYGCGEYGTKNSRPHYHIMIFGWKPDKIGKNNHGMRISPIVHRLWGKVDKKGNLEYSYGHHDVSDVHPETCAYVAGYVSKKMFPPDENTLRGYLNSVSPEFKIQSQGIGKQWILDNYKTVMRQNSVHCLNKNYTHIKQRIPRYYLKIIKDLCVICDKTKTTIMKMIFGNNSSYYSPKKFINPDGSAQYFLTSRIRNKLKKAIRYSFEYIKFCRDRLNYNIEKVYNLDNIIACYLRITTKHKNKTRQ